MSKIIVNHELYGPVLFDTETQTYEYIEKPANKTFTYNSKSMDYFDTAIDFFESHKQIGIFPVVCTESKLKGKRYYKVLIDHVNNPFTIFNIEIINSKWVKNNIENININNCYFLLVQKNSGALNDFIVLSNMIIKKGN